MKNDVITVTVSSETTGERVVRQESSEPIKFTPKAINVNFDAPLLRKHLDKAAIDRGWQIYKNDE